MRCQTVLAIYIHAYLYVYIYVCIVFMGQLRQWKEKISNNTSWREEKISQIINKNILNFEFFLFLSLLSFCFSCFVHSINVTVCVSQMKTRKRNSERRQIAKTEIEIRTCSSLDVDKLLFIYVTRTYESLRRRRDYVSILDVSNRNSCYRSIRMGNECKPTFLCISTKR